MTIDFVESPERWLAAFQAILEESPTYGEAASGWGVDFDGSILLCVRGDANHPDPPSFYVEPVDGGVREARVVRDADAVEAAYRLSAPLEVWKRLVRGEIDPHEAVSDGRLSFEGDLATALEYREAVVIMTVAASAIDTEFPG